MITTKDILDVCQVKVTNEDTLGWKRSITLTDKNNNEYKTILIWDSYDGYEFLPYDSKPLPDDIIELIESYEFEFTLDELTYNHKETE